MIKDNAKDLNIGTNAPMVTRKPSSMVVMANSSDRSKSGEQQSTHNLASLLSAVRRGWRIALPMGLCLSLISAYAGWKLMEPKFSASAYLRIDSDNRPLIFKTADETAGRGSDFQLYKNTQQQLMVTPFVLNAALRDAQLSGLEEIRSEEDPIGWLKANLKVSFPGAGEIMQVSVETVTSTSCVKIVNVVVEAFMQEVVMDERRDRTSRLERLEKVYSESEGKVRNKQNELKSLAASLGTSDKESLTVAQQSALTQFGHMQEKLGTIQFDLMQAEGELQIAEGLDKRQKDLAEQRKEKTNAGTGADSPTLVEPDLAETYPELSNLEDAVAIAEVRLKSLSYEIGTRHPVYLQAKQDVETKERLLARRKKDAQHRSKLVQPVVPSGERIFDLIPLVTRVAVLKNQEKILIGKVDRLADETRQLGKSSIDVELMRAEITSLGEVLRRVGEEIERTSIELKTSSRIKLLSSAASASPPDNKKRLTRVTAMGLFGLVAPFGLLIVWDLTRKRVNNVEGVIFSLSIPTMGTIPFISKNPLQRDNRNPLGRMGRKDAELDEALDAMSAMFLHCAELENRQVFMISSAVPGEGKSTVACQLAQGLAESGKKVALVDFDLRRPSIHRYMNVSLEPGVAETLSGHVPLEAALQLSSLSNLTILSAGNWKGHLHERCTSGAVNELFESLRSSFDMIIVDACPVLPVHDTRVIGKFTDGVILTLVRDRSRLPLATQACDILKSYGIPVIGTVIIGGSSTGYSSYYPYDKAAKAQRVLVVK